MKKILAFLALTVSALSVHADTGPLYIYHTDYCNIKELYISQYGDIYGKEVGCQSTLGNPFFGRMDQTSGDFYFSLKSGNRICLQVYTIGGKLGGGCSDGASSINISDISYRVSNSPPRVAAKSISGIGELPSIYD